MKKYAVIDIGTNSMRLLLATIKKNKTRENHGGCSQPFLTEGHIPYFIERKKYINTTRIGASTDKNKIISREGIEKNVNAFHDFVQKAEEYGAEKILAMATSAVRDAKNKEEFIHTIHRETGIDIKIIDGQEEAELGYKGVLMGIGRCHSETSKTNGALEESRFKCHSDLQSPVSENSFSAGIPNILVIDIGGGSTELILGTQHGNIIKTLSLDIGAVRMTKKFVTTDPIYKKEYEKMKTAIYETIKEAKQKQCHSEMDRINPAPEKFPSPCHSETISISLTPEESQSKYHWYKNRRGGQPCPPSNSRCTSIGIGGTITTLAALHQKLDPYDPEKVHNYKLTLKDINNLKEKLLSLTTQQIKQLKGIHPKRADIITAGITILSIIMDSFNLKEIIISEYDNLEGLLYKESLPT
ncbi:MAG: Ppx/GppA family phosphatase [Clostridiales bacterium]|nr:Ppx/GppA family phosphatase [Clostridiales bacterium]